MAPEIFGFWMGYWVSQPHAYYLHVLIPNKKFNVHPKILFKTEKQMNNACSFC